MSDAELRRRLDVLDAMLTVHGKMLAIVNTQNVVNAANNAVILSTLLEILAKHGVPKDVSQKVMGEILEGQLNALRLENEQAVRSPESSDGLTGESGVHRN